MLRLLHVLKGDTIMATTTTLPRHTFAGVTFAGRESHGIVTVPRPALRKIVASGRIRCRAAGTYTDDFAFDAATNYGKRDGVDPTLASRFAEDCPKTVSIWIRGDVLHVAASWKSYEIREINETAADATEAK